MEFDFIGLTRPVPMQLLAGRGHYEAVVQAVMGAEQSVWIATANLKELMVEDPRAQPGRRRTMRGRAGAYRSVLRVFDDAVARGVEVRILHAGPPSRPFREELRRCAHLTGRANGSGRFEMRACPRVHVKAVVIDGALLYLGSANWTGAGLGAKGEGRRNFEVGFLTRDDLLLDELQGYYDRIWRGGGCAGCKLRDECAAPLDSLRPAP
jgi:phosphatidylserine/phosphatidylglycerophosphate/cardiolipin synthase-like enzyme